MLNNKNSWTTTITNVDPTLTYYVYETAYTPHNGSTTKIDDSFTKAYVIRGDSKANGNGDTGFYKTITNSYNAGAFMSVEVFKIWTDDNLENTVYRPSSIQVTLLKDGEPVKSSELNPTGTIENPVTLNEENDWQYIWPALLSANTSTTGYSLVETTLDGYKAADEELRFGTNFGYGGFDNTYNTTSFTVTKNWENHGSSVLPKSVTAHLQISLDGGATYTDYDTDGTQKLTAAGDWQYTWTNLPSYEYSTGKERKIQYQVYEDPVDGYDTTLGTVSGNVVNGYTQTITNSSEYTTFKVSKIWNHG